MPQPTGSGLTLASWLASSLSDGAAQHHAMFTQELAQPLAASGGMPIAICNVLLQGVLWKTTSYALVRMPHLRGNTHKSDGFGVANELSLKWHVETPFSLCVPLNLEHDCTARVAMGWRQHVLHT